MRIDRAEVRNSCQHQGFGIEETIITQTVTEVLFIACRCYLLYGGSKFMKSLPKQTITFSLFVQEIGYSIGIADEKYRHGMQTESYHQQSDADGFQSSEELNGAVPWFHSLKKRRL